MRPRFLAFAEHKRAEAVLFRSVARMLSLNKHGEWCIRRAEALEREAEQIEREAHTPERGSRIDLLALALREQRLFEVESMRSLRTPPEPPRRQSC